MSQEFYQDTIYSIIDKVKNSQKKIDFYFDKSRENKEDMKPITADIIITSDTNFLGVKIDTENGKLIRKMVQTIPKSKKH